MRCQTVVSLIWTVSRLMNSHVDARCRHRTGPPHSGFRSSLTLVRRLVPDVARRQACEREAAEQQGELMLPSNLIFVWLTGLFSPAWLGGGLWLVWEWCDNWARDLPADPRLLVAGLVVLALALLGQPTLAFLLGRPTPAGEPDPGPLPGAPVLLCTHGWSLTSAAWHSARLHLAGRSRLLLWNLPGLGTPAGRATTSTAWTRWPMTWPRSCTWPAKVRWCCAATASAG